MNSGSGYTTSTVHQSPFGETHKWGSAIAAPIFTPSLYITLQVMTSTPIYTMEVNSSSGKIEKFSRRPGTISLKEFKVTFSTMVYELELKYGTNYTACGSVKEVLGEILDLITLNFNEGIDQELCL
jgi:hypothetical protein